MSDKMKRRDIEVGDIIQLDPQKTGNKMFSACLAIVDEVKTWGVQCYVQCTGENGEMGGQAYYRAEDGTYESTGGKAVWVKP